MARVRQLLYRNQRLKLIANHSYLYALHLLHLVLDLMPFFVRGLILRMLLAKVGRGTYFDVRVYFKFPWLIEIGSNVSVNRGVEFYPEFLGRHRILIGDNVRIAPNVRFHAAAHETDGPEYRHTGGDIEVGRDCWIGAGALIMPGVSIGDGCIIGAGSVVTKNIPDGSVAAGVPARVIRARATAAPEQDPDGVA